MWHPPMQPEVMQHWQLLIAKSHTTNLKFQTFELRASSITPWFGEQTVDHTQQSPEPYNTQRTLQRAATDGKCRQTPSSNYGNTKSK